MNDRNQQETVEILVACRRNLAKYERERRRLEKINEPLPLTTILEYLDQFDQCHQSSLT